MDLNGFLRLWQLPNRAFHTKKKFCCCETPSSLHVRLLVANCADDCGQTDRQKDIQTDRQTDRQRDIQTDRQTH